MICKFFHVVLIFLTIVHESSPHPVSSNHGMVVKWPKSITDEIKNFPLELNISHSLPTTNNFISIGLHSRISGRLIENNCPFEVNTVSRRLKSRRNFAPFVWVKNVNNTRYPPVVREASCLCTHCYNTVNNARLSYALVIPVQITMNVAVRSAVNREPVITTETFTVGCTCEASQPLRH